MNKKMMPHIIAATAFVVFIMLAMTCATGSSTSNNYMWKGDFRYEIIGEGKDQTVRIIYYRGSNQEVVIPDNINGRSVTSIGASAFGPPVLSPKYYKFTSVNIPASVTSIGGNAFRDNLLTNIIIPEGVTFIGDGAFANNRLTSVNIPARVTSIRNSVFEKNQLTSVTIPLGITSIGERAFANNQLTSVTIPSGVTSIGKGAFAENQLTNVTIPEGVASIGVEAFEGNQLTSITIPASATSIGINALGDTLLNYYLFNGDLLAGTYENRNNQWYRNGTALVTPAILRLGSDVWLVSIDGKSPGSFHNVGLTRETPTSITQNIYGINSLSNFPARITQFYGSANSTPGRVYLPPGTHTIEVIYLARIDRGISYTTDSMLWEQRYLFEGYTYEVTATPTADGKQIQFGIRRQ